MMTAMLSARNILAGEKTYDVWSVNDDCQYLEVVDQKSQNSQVALAVPAERPEPSQIGVPNP